MSAAPVERPLSEKQEAYIRFLTRIHDVPAEHLERMNSKIERGEVSVEEASQIIDWMKRLPLAPHPDADDRGLTEGMYLHDGKVYKVERGVTSWLYAKQLMMGDKPYFQYVRGATMLLKPSDKLTLEQAKELGAMYGTCCVCGRLLTDEGSVKAGIGPVCATKGEMFR